MPDVEYGVAAIFYLGLAATPLPLGLALLLLVVFPYATYERRNRQAWRKLTMRRMGRGGPYRRALLSGSDVVRAPFIVRAAALSCFFLGAGCLPVAMAAITMVTGGDVTGLVLALPALVLLRLWAAGMRLLEPEVESLRSVRRATRALVHVSFPLALASLPLALFVGAFPSLEREGVVLVLTLGAFSLACLGECALLARATSSAARLLPEAAGDRVRSTPAIPAWMQRALARKLVSP